MLNLSQIKTGQFARITSITGERSIHSRLMEIGFVPGRSVKLLRMAPLGDPAEYLIDGTRIALRKADAAAVLIDPLPAVSTAD